jgi:uncharacterized membrane protein
MVDMMTKLRKTFFNDDDGFSAKDFLMVLFGGLYALFLVVAFFAPFIGIPVAAGAMTVIGSMSGVVMTIVGGVFAVQTVKEFRTPNEPTNIYPQIPSIPVVEQVNDVEESNGEGTPRI